MEPTEPERAALANSRLSTVSSMMSMANNTIKTDKASLAEEAAEKVQKSTPSPLKPVLSFLRKALGSLPPFTLQAVGTSSCISPLALCILRALLATIFAVLSGASLTRKIWGAVFPATLYFLLYIVLAALSISSSIYSTRLALWQLTTAVGIIYQTLASLAIFVAPLAAVLFGRNVATKTRHTLIFVAYLLPIVAFVIDSAVGAEISFHMLFAPIPAAIASIVIATKFIKMKEQMHILYGALYIWACMAPLIAVAVSRMSGCWGKNKSALEEEEEASDIV